MSFNCGQGGRGEWKDYAESLGSVQVKQGMVSESSGSPQPEGTKLSFSLYVSDAS